MKNKRIKEEILKELLPTGFTKQTLISEAVINTLGRIEETIDELALKKIKDFGISMAGKYRNQGMLEFKKELKDLLKGDKDNK